MKEHIAYFDILRIIAILAVITLHVAAPNFDNANVFSSTWEISNFWNGLVRWGVPIFVMVSGALFLDPAREFNFKKLYCKNIFRIGIILAFWSVFYASLGFITGPDQGNMERFVVHTVLGHFHLWFLYMLLGLYIVVPLLRPICQDVKLIRYFLLLSLCFSFLVPTILRILTDLNLIIPNSAFLKGLHAIGGLVERTHFHFTLGYVAYFVLGYYMYQTKLSLQQQKLIYILGILGATFTILYSQFISHSAQIPLNIYDSLTLNILFETLAVFVFVKYHVHMLCEKLVIISNYLSKRVLGIYLIHVEILDCLNKLLNLSSTSIDSLFSIPFIAVLAFISSWFIVEVFKRIPLLNKCII